jgi:hypothetical protein
MPIEPLPLVDLVVGLMLVGTIALAATRSLSARRSPLLRVLGWALVAVPLPLTVGFRLFMPSHPAGGEAPFVLSVVAFAFGAVLILARGSEGNSQADGDTVPAPWWPEFEREFRDYARRQSRPTMRI